MDLDELRSVQSKERRKDSLQHLRDSFYEDVATYLNERKRQRDERAAAVDNPFSDQQVRKLSDEIETAEEVVESLYERRVGKVVKLSSFAAAGAPTDTEGMTIQEAELFEDLVVRIEQNKQRVLDVLETGSDVDVGAEAAASAASEATQETDTPEAVAPTASAPSAAPSGSDSSPSSHPSDDAAAGGGVLADAMGTTERSDDDTATESPDAGAGAAGSSSDTPATPPDVPSDETLSASTTSGEPSTDSASGPGGEPDTEANDEPGEFVPGSEPDRAGGSTDTESQTGDPAPDATPGGDANDRQTVRITRDIGQILGVDDVEYDLASEDVVSLPADNVGPLVERDAAEPIE